MNAEKQDLWVYGIVPAGASLDEVDRREGLPEVWVEESGDLAAIVGDVPENDEKGTRNQALAHARVLEAAVVDAPVVPFRFGVIVPADDEVSTGLLEANHDELAQHLKQIDDRVQMTLKVYYHEDEVLREIVEKEPEIAQLREQMREGSEEATRDVRVRLGELVSNAVEQRRQRDGVDIVERLKSVSLGIVDGGLEREFMVLNAAVLIERERQQELEEAVEEVADERQERMRFRLLGPMPPYNFIGNGEGRGAD
jgi:hypothetical protein